VVVICMRVFRDVLGESFTPARIKLDLIDESLISRFRCAELGEASRSLRRSVLARESQVAGIVVQRRKIAWRNQNISRSCGRHEVKQAGRWSICCFLCCVLCQKSSQLILKMSIGDPTSQRISRLWSKSQHGSDQRID